MLEQPTPKIKTKHLTEDQRLLILNEIEFVNTDRNDLVRYFKPLGITKHQVFKSLDKFLDNEPPLIEKVRTLEDGRKVFFRRLIIHE